MKLKIILGLIITGTVLFILIKQTYYRVQFEERAVIFKPFSGGLDKENVVQPGIYYDFPWNDIHIYYVMEDRTEEELNVLDKHGNSLNVKINVRYSLMPDKIGFLHEEFGKHYEDIMIVPELRSVTRQVMGRYSAEEIYNSKRKEVELNIKNEVKRTLSTNYVQLKGLPIISVELPPKLRKALEEEDRQKQLSEESK